MKQQDILSLFNPALGPQNFDRIRISVAGPEAIMAWSHGEVKKPETINYRTLKPERDGLFCARIFGPVKDYECLCGKYKRMKYRGVVCEKCGVEVTTAKVRRERMGHISLAAPVAHIWFLKSLPGRISTLLDLALKDVEKILYFDAHIVIEPGLTALKPRQLLTESEYYDAVDQYGEDSFTAGIGAEAVRDLLADMDLETERDSLREELGGNLGELRQKKLLKRLKLIEAFIDSGSRPEWMILTVLPVIPPELRPLVPLDGGRFATSDLNDLYRRVINRNSRLKRLIELRAPDIIIRNEKRMLQEAVDALFDNGRRGRAIVGTAKRPLKSLSDMLKGKQGRFRQNLLGKRVDYSGRSVIVVGPELKLHQCGLPQKMALELFKPFIYAGLEARGIAQTVKQAKRIVEKERPEVWEILDEVVREHPVLLNRAPTLHRLGIQAFEPVLIEGKALQLHPLVCTAFNADFDGDQMAVHVPLSPEAQLEARVLMMASNNVLSPANGKPIIVPSQDIVLGAYYLSFDRFDDDTATRCFSSMAEIEHAIADTQVNVHTKIHFRFDVVQADGSVKRVRAITTPGRAILAALLPKVHNVDYTLVNKLLTKKDLGSLIDAVYRHCGQKETVVFCDQLMKTCFKHAFKAGISFCKDDMVVPAAKERLIAETTKIVRELEQQYQDGFITRSEKYNKVVDAWSKCTDKVAEAMMAEISKPIPHVGGGRDINSIYMMAHSGARGSAAQMKQLSGMRGLMAKPSGEIIETPIISNFKEGLSVLEYFNSTHGARKGLADTALKTANSGYLTRRLVDVAQDCIVRENDCGTVNGLTVAAVVSGGEIVETLAERVLGRTAAEDLKHPKTGETMLLGGQEFTETLVMQGWFEELSTIRIRSVLTCDTKLGVCAKCYGRDLARGTPVNMGEAVGIVAAQSIGEPGTQLTMRTFHVGGTAQVAQQSFIELGYDGVLHIKTSQIVVDRSGHNIVMSRNTRAVVVDAGGIERAQYKLPYGARLLVNAGEDVKRGQKLCQWDPYTVPVIAEKDAQVKFIDLYEGLTFRETMDEATGITNRVVTDRRSSVGGRGEDLRPSLALVDAAGNPILSEAGKPALYALAPDTVLSVLDGVAVHAGDVLARIPREGTKTRDITGGLPRVAELFEARRPKEQAIIAICDGVVRFDRDYKNKRRLLLEPADGAEAIEYLIPKNRHLMLQDGDTVAKGEFIVEGTPAPHDILEIMGIEALADYLIREVQDVYRLQGVKINNKHIEVIVRQMLQKLEVTHPGDSTYLAGEHLDEIEFDEINQKLESRGLRPMVARPVLLGITKASLQTRSFISAASFQETTRVLTDAAVSGKSDTLVGLKENVIVGRLIPAGTGSAYARFKAAMPATF